MASAAEDRRVTLRATGVADLDFVLGLEARDDYAAFIFRWPRERHLAALDDRDLRHFVICDPGGERLGFAILGGIDSGDGRIELTRIALARPGAGVGGAALAALSARVFGELGAACFWLDVFEDNTRARRAYQRAGFVEQPGPPVRLQRAGEAAPLVIMSLTRDAFLERSGAGRGAAR